MALVGLVFAVVVIGGVWLLRRQKAIAQDRAIAMGAIVAGIAGSAGSTFYFWKTTGHSEDRAWWPASAVVGSMIWLCVVMVVAVVVRLLVAQRARRG
jgi:cytochrome bd-type quinol oxidase subunit 2